MTHRILVNETGESFSCSEDQNLLEGMRTFRLGVPLLDAIPIGCRGGGCGICRVQVSSGEFQAEKMSVKHVPEDDRDAGIALACRVYPRSDLQITVLSLPENKP